MQCAPYDQSACEVKSPSLSSNPTRAPIRGAGRYEPGRMDGSDDDLDFLLQLAEDIDLHPSSVTPVVSANDHVPPVDATDDDMDFLLQLAEDADVPRPPSPPAAQPAPRSTSALHRVPQPTAAKPAVLARSRLVASSEHRPTVRLLPLPPPAPAPPAAARQPTPQQPQSSRPTPGVPHPKGSAMMCRATAA